MVPVVKYPGVAIPLLGEAGLCGVAGQRLRLYMLENIPPVAVFVTVASPAFPSVGLGQKTWLCLR